MVTVIVPEVCRAIYSALMATYLKVPQSENEWENVAKKFYDFWQFPNCIGSLDGKHVVFRAPSSAGSHHYNYKGTNSIVLMALLDADYQFLYIDVGRNGRMSDGGVWSKTDMFEAIENNTLNIPGPKLLPNSTVQTPMVLVADEAFALKRYSMRPFPRREMNADRRIYNYRLSRARRVVENAFGILSSRWEVFRSPIRLSAAKVRLMVLATCALHSFLRSKTVKTRSLYTPDGTTDREDIQARFLREESDQNRTVMDSEICRL